MKIINYFFPLDAILTLVYPCPNKKKGCEWTGKENDKPKHLQNDCTFENSFKIHLKKRKILRSMDSDDDEIQMISQKQRRNEYFHPTFLIPPDQNFQPGDFAIPKDQLLGEVGETYIWRLDTRHYFQRFNLNGIGVYYSDEDYIFTRYDASKRHKYVSIGEYEV